MADLDADYFARTGSYTTRYFRDVYPAIDPRQPALSQAGRVVVVTGASSGLGALGFAPAFAQAGARAVVLVARRREQLAQVAERLRGEYPGVEFLAAAVASVTDEAEVGRMFAEVRGRFGRVDVLVNNAGGATGMAGIADVAADDWWANFELNVKGAFLVTRAFLAALAPGQEGVVINLTSAAATAVFPNLSGYSIAKMAINRFTEHLVAENPNVFSAALDPGTVDTGAVPEAYIKFARDTPLLAGASAVWLASPQAKFMAGRTFKAGWDVEELVRRKEEISAGSMMKFVLGGKPAYSS